MAAPLLACHGLTRRFGGLAALEDLDLEVRRGEILGLIGPNGSGKTTFFNVVTGIYPASAGRVEFDGRTSRLVAAAGIPRRHRAHVPALAPVPAALDLRQHHGRQPWAPGPRAGFNLFRRRAFRAQFEASYAAARELVVLFDPPLADRLFEAVAGIPMIDRRRIEICRALISRPKLLLLDEPSAGMTHEETRHLMDDILSVRARRRTSRSSSSSTR